MAHTPPALARQQKTLRKKMQEGTIVSWTRVMRPPAEYGSSPRTIGLILLKDGTQVMGEIAGENAAIGKHVTPRMRLNRITEEGLRIYDVAYEITVRKAVEKLPSPFPGYVLAFTGPSGVGKSTITRMLVHMAGDYAENVPILTTRRPKKGDESEYRYVSERRFMELKKTGKVVAATEIPSQTESRHYGYLASDIATIWKRGKLPVVVTEMHLLQDLARHYGRRSILSFGLLPPGKSKRAMLSALLHRLRERGRDTEAAIKDRINNAVRDLQFFKERADLFDHLIVNENLEAVVETVRQKMPEGPR